MKDLELPAMMSCFSVSNSNEEVTNISRICCSEHINHRMYLSTTFCRVSFPEFNVACHSLKGNLSSTYIKHPTFAIFLSSGEMILDRLVTLILSEVEET